MAIGLSRRRVAVLSVSVASLAAVGTARAQSGLESALEQYSGARIQGYVQPLADALVANLSIGYANSATSPRRFSFSLELVGMTAAIDESMRTYTANTPAGFQPTTHETSTIFGGPAQPVQHSTIPGLSYRGADGLVDAEYFPAAAPQLRLGGLFGTELVVRYASSSMVQILDEDDFPDLTLLGIGIQHSISQYLMLPLDISVAASFNSIKFGDFVDLSATSFGVNVGRSFGLFGVSGGIVSEGGTMNLTYTSTDPSGPGNVDVDIDVKRSVRFRAGAALNLGFIKIFGDAAVGDIMSYAAGLRLGI
jgi:hypothetical protein